MEDSRNAPTASALCILALCMPHSMRGRDFPYSLEPLTLREYNKFAVELQKSKLRPEQLPQYIASPIGDGQIMSCADCADLAYIRIARLIETIPDCKKIVEGWSASHDLWVVGRGDPEYPKRLKDKMMWNAPAFLFGVGNKDILNAENFVAVAGSRAISSERYAEAKRIGEKIVEENLCLVSGAARGSDKASMIGALEAMDRRQMVRHGERNLSVGVLGVLGILPNELARRSKYEEWMNEGVRSGKLTLMTTEAPDAPFTPRAAYARNDLIHAMGRATVVVECEVEKGGTWGGATLAAKHGIMERLFVLDGEANDSLSKECSKSIGKKGFADVSVFDVSKPIMEQISSSSVQLERRATAGTESIETTDAPQSERIAGGILPAGNYVVYTDGGCRPNPGVGGWGAVILQRGEDVPMLELHGGELDATNNRMELTAALNALKTVKGSRVELYTDSQYLKKAFTDGWLDGWVRNGWSTISGSPVKNRDLWQKLLRAVKEVDIKWRWTRGHVGDIWNERCDELAGQEIERIAAGGISIALQESSLSKTLDERPPSWEVHIVKASGDNGKGHGNVEWRLLSPHGDVHKSQCDEYSGSTVPRMVLQAVADALTEIPDGETVSIVTSLEYVRDALNDGWLERWERNHWLGRSGEVKNADLWRDIAADLRRLKLGLVRAPAPGEYLRTPERTEPQQLAFDWTEDRGISR